MTGFKVPRPIFVYDLECTCWNDRKHRSTDMEIIQIAGVLIAPGLETLWEFNRYVRPGKDPVLSAYCTELTGIDQFTIYNSQGLPWVLGHLDAFIQSRLGSDARTQDIISASWGCFDHKQLHQDCRRYGFTFPFHALHVDVKRMIQTNHHLDRGGLDAVAAWAGLTFDGRQHDALTDAKMTYELMTRFCPIDFNGSTGSQNAG